MSELDEERPTSIIQSTVPSAPPTHPIPEIRYVYSRRPKTDIAPNDVLASSSTSKSDDPGASPSDIGLSNLNKRLPREWVSEVLSNILFLLLSPILVFFRL